MQGGFRQLKFYLLCCNNAASVSEMGMYWDDLLVELKVKLVIVMLWTADVLCLGTHDTRTETTRGPISCSTSGSQKGNHMVQIWQWLDIIKEVYGVEKLTHVPAIQKSEFNGKKTT